jgi:hypothetical protein
MAVFSPRGQQQFATIKDKFVSDLAGVVINAAIGIAFVTNQELRLAERKELHLAAAPAQVDLFHLERITAVLDSPKMAGVRKQFLSIDYSDQVAPSLAASITSDVVGGSTITTINQSGGQVAHQIINNGEPRRLVTATSLDELVRRLRGLPSERYFISASVGHAEAYRLAETLYLALKRAAWTTDADGPGQLLGSSPPVRPGIHIIMDSESQSATVFALWCAEENLQPTLSVGALAPLYFPNTVNILVGPAPED